MSIRQRSTGMAAALLLLSAGCTIGAWSRQDRTAADGGLVRLETHDARLEGELLAADEVGLLVLSEGRVYRAPWDAVARLRFRNRPVEPVVAPGGTPPMDVMRGIQLASRYPYGLTEEQLAQVLISLGQAELRVTR